MNYYAVEYLRTPTNALNPWKLCDGRFVMPLNIAAFLDERLDEGSVTCYHDTVASYPVNTIFRVTAGEQGTSAKDKYYLFRLSQDDAQEMPNGSGKYKHTLSFVELTKYLEGIVCQTLTFTNPLGRKYTDYATAIYPSSVSVDSGQVRTNLQNFRTSLIRSPVESGAQITLSSPYDLSAQIADYLNEVMPANDITTQAWSVGIIGDNKSSWSSGTETGEFTRNETATVTAKSPFTITYKCAAQRFERILLADPFTLVLYDITLEYELYVAQNRLPTKRRTIKDVINRCLALCEPLFGNDTSRFKLDATQAAELDKIIAPEFSMAQSTLREQLKVIGGYIHAEPRISNVTVSPTTGRIEYTIKYDYYGRYSVANLPAAYLRKEYAATLAEYCTRVHTNAVNLVNSLSWNAGVVSDPDEDIYRAERSDTINVRVEDSNGICQTALPIYQLKSVKCGIYRYNNDGTVSAMLPPEDISGYVYEATEYDSLLSSYAGTPGFSKSYALRYEIGSKNIEQLFFEAPNAITAALENPAIIKILSLVSGKTEQEIRQMLARDEADTILVFNVVYKPIFSTAYSHGKQLYNPNREDFTMVYNQSNGLIESTYYGENVKGVAARLGNVDYSATYILPSLDDVPAIGECVGDYFISTVSVEMDSFTIKCTVGMTKDFNRISQFIGVNSMKRISEISTSQPYDRNVILGERLIIGEKPDNYDGSKYIGGKAVCAFYDAFRGNTADTNPRSMKRPASALFLRYDEEAGGEGQNRITLPIVSVPLGNVVSLVASFKDNYSAGEKLNYSAKIVTTGKDDLVAGFWAQDVPFCDFYGRARYVGILIGDLKYDTADQKRLAAFTVPETTAYTPASPHIVTPERYLLMKDSRERLATFAYNIECCTTIPNLNIGSGLAMINSLVDTRDHANPEFRIIPAGAEMPNKLDTDVLDYDRTKWRATQGNYTIAMAADGYSFNMSAETAGLPAGEYLGWVIYMPITTTSEQVIDEEGNEVTQKTESGGEILLSSFAPFTQTRDDDSFVIIDPAQYTFYIGKI